MKNGTEKFDTASVAKAVARVRRPYALTAAFVLSASLASSAVALAQNAGPQVTNGPATVPSAPAAAPAPAAPGQSAPQAGSLFPNQPPPAGEKPGFIYAFGRWWDDTRGKIGDLSKQQGDATNGAAAATQDVLKGAAEATKNAATAIARLPVARFVEGHQRCAVAPNGAPDCRTAAANVCRSKGFTDGHPVNVQSSQNCPPAVWMSGREPAPGECPEETVVLMAACN
jgi:hypothetical protein